MTPSDFENMLIRHEGMELQLYEDSVGKLTIGVGYNIEDRGITEEDALYFMRNDIARFAKELTQHYPFVRDLDAARYYVLMDMMYNMGLQRLSGFKKMWTQLSVGNYEAAANEMLDSKWAKQVKGRAVELAELMRKGTTA